MATLRAGLPVINKNNFCYISPICPEANSEWISTKFGIRGPLADVIISADFLSIGSGVLLLWEVEICLFPSQFERQFRQC